MAEIAAAAAEWIGQHVPAGQGPCNGLSPSDYRGLCKLCLVPIELVQMPTLQLQPDVQCLVSVVVAGDIVQARAMAVCINNHLLELHMSCLPDVDQHVAASYFWL